MALEAGSRLGPYEVVGLLASGGMGEVYRARDPRLDREVAIKVRAAGALNHQGDRPRDLKPDNVFITEDGRVKMLDFGLAKLTRPAPLFEEGHDGKAAEGTESATIVGTAGHMSPEQVRGQASTTARTSSPLIPRVSPPGLRAINARRSNST